MTTTIRPVESDRELEDVFAFVQQGLRLSDRHPRDLAFYRMARQHYPDLLIAAMRDDQLVGAILASTQPGDTGVLIGELYVSPGSRRSGVGGSLLHAVEGTAKRLGRRQLLLGGLESAHGFYLAGGFQPQLFFSYRGEKSAQQMEDLLERQLIGLVTAWRSDEGSASSAIVRTTSIDPSLVERIETTGAETQWLFTKDLCP